MIVEEDESIKEEAHILEEEVTIGKKKIKLIISQVHKEGVNMEINKEEVVVILNVSVATNLVIWQVNVSTKKKKTITLIGCLAIETKCIIIKILCCSCLMVEILKMSST